MVPLHKILAEKNASATHFFRVLTQNRILEMIDDISVNESQQNFVILLVIPRSISVQNLSKIGQETKKLKKWEMTPL